jgi:hypothetical protein
MNKLISDLAAMLAWIWMTPERAPVLVRERDITWDIQDAHGLYAQAA